MTAYSDPIFVCVHANDNANKEKNKQNQSLAKDWNFNWETVKATLEKAFWDFACPETTGHFVIQSLRKPINFVLKEVNEFATILLTKYLQQFQL